MYAILARMKLLFDFFPVLLFVIAYKLSNIFAATGVAITAALGQFLYYWFKNKKLEVMHWFSLALVVVLGGATLFFHNELFIKWKPTALNWFLALVFLGSHFVGRKPMIQILLGSHINTKPVVWRRLSYSWIAFFILMGFANLWVAYHFPTDTWVNFKLFGVIGLTFVFVFLQALFLTRHVEEI